MLAQNFLNNKDNVPLCREYMSDELIDFMNKASEATFADAIIRARNLNKNCLETLEVAYLGDDNYIVRYRWTKENPESEKRIPVRAVMLDGKCRITHIEPEVEFDPTIVYREVGIQ